MTGIGTYCTCLILCVMIHISNARPNGAPEEVCSRTNLMPLHLFPNGSEIAAVQDGATPPYVVIIRDTPTDRKYGATSVLKVQIIRHPQYTENAAPNFRGLILQMRDSSGPPKPVGTFILNPNLAENLAVASTLGYNIGSNFQLLKCPRSTNDPNLIDNSVTHTNNNDKTVTGGLGVTFSWRPNINDGIWNEDTGYGDIHAKASVVLNHTTFWVALQTGYLNYDAPCSSNPCAGGSNVICTNQLTGSFTCTCTNNYFGSSCEYNCNTALPACLNGASCNTDITSRNNGQYCSCPTGYTGPFCGTPIINACSSSPCGSFGVCVPIPVGFVCSCINDYFGSRCEYNCPDSPPVCANGGSCNTDQTTRATEYCSCPNHAAGPLCASYINCPTSQTVALDGSNTQTQVTWPVPQMFNFATASPFYAYTDGTNGLTLQTTTINGQVQAGFDVGTTNVQLLGTDGTLAVFCNFQITVSPCVINQCLNGGTCNPSNTGFSCDCRNTGFSGPLCRVDECYEACPVPNENSQCLRCPSGTTCIKNEQGIFQGCSDGCVGNPCNNGGTCVSSNNGAFFCQCLVGYTGSTCDQIAGCNLNPCSSTGTVRCDPVGQTGYNCVCNQDWVGTLCNYQDPCRSNLGPAGVANTCNPGICTLVIPYAPWPTSTAFANFTCKYCPTGLSGEFCHIVTCDPTCINGQCLYNQVQNRTTCSCFNGWNGIDCTTPVCSLACQNGGQCISNNGVSVCNCIGTGFNGPTCEIPVCSPICQNSGTCIVINGVGVCNCIGTGFNGPSCEIPQCTPSCQNTGNCVDINGVPTCECPQGYSGSACETVFCTPQCLNGGSCIGSNGAPPSCQCPAGYSGADCSIPVGCNASPCLNNGICQSDGQIGYTCLCTLPYFGAVCEQRDDCAVTQCLNGGTCQTDSNGVFTSCACPLGYSGTLCDIRDDCAVTQCLNGGTCQTDSNGIFTSCACPLGYSGTLCDIHNPCVSGSHDCGVNGQCIPTLGANFPYQYLCECQDGWHGRTCENPPLGCADAPCQNGGVCTTVGTTGFSCECFNGWFGVTCIYRDACLYSDIDCLNGGTCSSNPSTGAFITCEPCSTGYSGLFCQVDVCDTAGCVNGDCIRFASNGLCQCYPTWSGQYCDQPIACDSNPCLNGGSCSHTPDGSFTCQCTTGWSGPLCNIPLACQPGSPNPCQNGGTCTATTGSNYYCLCPPAWTGEYCQIAAACLDPTICRNGGTCIHDAAGLFTTCRCPPGYSGTYCERDGCSPSPCGAYGYCELAQTAQGYNCICRDGYTGQNCEIAPVCGTGFPNDPCYPNGICKLSSTSANGYECDCYEGFFGHRCQDVCSNLCLNGASCRNDGFGSITCVCINGYSGQYCENRPICVNNPCQNGGTCIPHLSDALQFRCDCTQQYTGDRCEILSGCHNNPCMNGGRCDSDESGGYTCNCVRGYTGRHCSVEPVCVTNPCYNGQCIPSNGNPTCSCYDGYIGTYCEIRNECHNNYVLCSNGGTCQHDTQTGRATCLCTDLFRGERCNIPNLTLCVENICFNGGTCWEDPAFGSICTCIDGYGGDLCEAKIISCAERNCAIGNGYCEEANYARGTTSRCICNQGWTGETCRDRYVDPCLHNPCRNSGVCTSYGTSTHKCDCRPGFIGFNCETRAPIIKGNGSKTLASLWTLLVAFGACLILGRL